MLNKNIFAVLFFVLILVSVTSAQFKSGGNIWSVNGGYTYLNVTESEQNLTGYAITGTFDQVSWDLKYSGGFTFGYLRSMETYSNAEYVYSSLPFVLQGKYYLITKKVPFYLQGGIGMHFSKLERTSEFVYTAYGDVGLVLNAGTGIFIPLSSSLSINLSYQFNWYETTFYKDGMVHLFRVGLAFN